MVRRRLRATFWSATCWKWRARSWPRWTPSVAVGNDVWAYLAATANALHFVGQKAA